MQTQTAPTTYDEMVRKYQPIMDKLRPYAKDSFEDFSQWAWLTMFEDGFLEQYAVDGGNFRAYLSRKLRWLWADWQRQSHSRMKSRPVQVDLDEALDTADDSASRIEVSGDLAWTEMRHPDGWKALLETDGEATSETTFRRLSPPQATALRTLFREERAVRLQDEYMMAGVKPIMTDPTLADIKKTARLYHKLTGGWPTMASGPVPGMPGVTWATVSRWFLQRRLAGMRKGQTLPLFISDLSGILPKGYASSP